MSRDQSLSVSYLVFSIKKVSGFFITFNKNVLSVLLNEAKSCMFVPCPLFIQTSGWLIRGSDGIFTLTVKSLKADRGLRTWYLYINH